MNSKKKVNCTYICNYLCKNYLCQFNLEKLVPHLLTKMENSGVLQLDDKNNYEIY